MDEQFFGMLIFSSVQLFCLGPIGEYLGRMYTQTKQRPLFIIREIVSAPVAVEQPPAKVAEFALGAESLSHKDWLQ
jgi:hypothetical protein